MRVLMLTQTTPHLPTHDRARLVPAYLLAHLAEGHEIALITPETPGDTPAQRAWASSVAAVVTRVPVKRWRHALGAPADGLAAMRAAARAAIDEWRPDIVHLEGTLLAPLAAALPVPVVIGCRESAVRRARDARRLARTPREWMRAQIEERLETEWERRWLPAAQGCVVASEDDRRTLAERVPFERIGVVPPGVDETRYDFRRAGEAARLIFAGNLAWPSHLDAARRLALRVLPLVRRAWPAPPPTCARASGARRRRWCPPRRRPASRPPCWRRWRSARRRSPPRARSRASRTSCPVTTCWSPRATPRWPRRRCSCCASPWWPRRWPPTPAR